jgi:heat shock protein HslJ
MRDLRDAYIRAANARARARDKTYLNPVIGVYNITERAITQLRKAGITKLLCDDYEAALETRIKAITEGERKPTKMREPNKVKPL